MDVNPAKTTRYRLSAADASGKTDTRDLTITVGAPLAKIVEVRVSSVSVPHGCIADRPGKTTSYVVSAVGADGDHDRERFTVRVE